MEDFYFIILLATLSVILSLQMFQNWNSNFVLFHIFREFSWKTFFPLTESDIGIKEIDRNYLGEFISYMIWPSHLIFSHSKSYTGTINMDIFLLLVNSRIPTIMSSISTVKIFSIMSRVSPKEILNLSATEFFFTLEYYFREILKKFECFSVNSLKISYE